MMELTKLYSKTSKGKLNSWTIWTEGNEIHTRWGESEGKLQHKFVTVEGKNIGRSNETTPPEQAQLEAKSKWAAQIRKKYYETAEEAMSTLNIKPMRAYTLDEKREKKLKFPVDVQPKFDGVRCMAYTLPDGSLRLMSRGGKDYTAPLIAKELEGMLAPTMCLDGELYIHGESLQSIRHLQAAEDDRLCFHVYDYTSLPARPTPWVDRKAELDKWFKATHKHTPHVVQVETKAALSMNNIKVYHDAWVEQGYEGLMVRTMEGKYKLAGKSTDLLKVKMFQDEEFLVVGWDTDSRDGVIRFHCKVEGVEKPMEVRPVGTMEQRAKLAENPDQYLGQLLTVKYQQLSDTGVPIFPVGKSFRPTADLD